VLQLLGVAKLGVTVIATVPGLLGALAVFLEALTEVGDLGCEAGCVSAGSTNQPVPTTSSQRSVCDGARCVDPSHLFVFTV